MKQRYRINGVEFVTLQAALDAAKPGDVIEAAGTIASESALVRTANVTLRGPALLEGGAGVEALIVVRAPGFVVEEIEAVTRGAGAFIRLEGGGDLRLRRCRVHGAGQGLCAESAQARVMLEDCVFEREGCALQVGRIAELRIRGGCYGDAGAGRCIQSRAAKTFIEGARIREGSGGAAIDLPDGGEVELAGCDIERALEAGASRAIVYGGEGEHWPHNAFHFYASNSVAGAAELAPLVDFALTPKVMLVEAARTRKAPPASVGASQIPVAPFFELADTPLDGPTWRFLNSVLAIKWMNPGGDWRDAREEAQGAVPYAAMSVPVGTVAQDVVFDVTALAQRWLQAGNTGLHLRRVSGPVADIASRADTGNPGPRLAITTSAGTYDCACLASTWVASSSSSALQGPTIQSPALMRFDLSAIKGTPTSASLTIRVIRTYSGAPPLVLHVNRLDARPIVIDPARQVGKARPGMATALARDSDLSSQPGVLTYDDLVSEDYIKSNYLVVPPTSTEGIKLELDPTYGFTRVHCYGGPANQMAVGWHKWAQPLDAPPARLVNAPWRRPYEKGKSLGHDDVYLRYMLRIGADLRDAFNELGLKLPGLCGTYNWSTSGARTLPAPSSDGTFEARLWLSRGSDAHPHIYRGATYWKAADRPISRYPRDGENRYFNRVDFCFRAEQDYCVEQHMKLNTLNADGSPNSDGVYQVWIDGVLVHEQTDVYIRKYPEVQIQDLPFVNVYHGGMGKPKARYHVSLAAIGTATKYIGPPPVLSSARSRARQQPS